MKEKKYVISSKCTKLYYPITGTITWYLLLDKFHPPQWVWGFVGALVGLVYIFITYYILSTDEIERKPKWEDLE